ncbi:PREDICTED: uncharacterized protein LOC109585277 [Amphimedon queenslandica]|uniref:RING-type E3 ubiquitin transferase n=1 Tax=Amphimedon queenslandica TaxID=400682 RepID=A0A1X7TZU2_AMPQE|nr:PREDICTED: uncharacterized protein LOC109585277 [Amphimedon queenslandica]|eukprot:XP_019856835.1 PREDICTED: uncharacterized protein LOC109585277 [Amphimedon queenslandica]
MAENLDENSYSSLPSKLPTASTTVNVCVLVNKIPLYCESNDVAKCLEAQPVSLPLSPLSINDVHVVPTQSGGNASSPATKHAVLAVTASNVEAIPRNLQLQDGILSSSNMIPMFQEKATASFTLIHGTEPIMQYLVSQGEKLSVQLEFKGNNVKVCGSCSQVYKFRQYLANLLTENILALPPSHHAQHNPQAIHTHNTVNPVPEQVPPEGGSNEGAAATGGSSAGDGKTFTGLSKDVLLLMPKVRKDCSKNMQFFPEEGKVIVLASSEEEREQCITQFQNSYQEIIKNRQLKSGSLEIPPAFQIENMFGLLEDFDSKYSQCHFSCDEKARVVRIVSMSSRQFDQAKKLLGDRLAGEKGDKWEEKTGKKKEEKGGGGKPGKGAKIPTKPGSSETLSINKGHKLTVKRGNIVEEDVDAIVNAANSRLDHGAGVAGALSKASNGELQRVSNAYIRNYGQLQVGEAAVTSAGGKLKCKRVIHAVGPIAHEVKSDLACSQFIYQAITNSLLEAEKMKAASISFPALSTGIYAVKKSLAADAIFQAILKFHYTSSKVLTDIRIVILDEDTYSVFAQHLLAIKSNPTHTETSFQSPGADTHGNVSQSNGSSSHGSHTPGPTALSENSLHAAASGGKSKAWSETGSGATGTGNTPWTGQGGAGNTAWSGQGGAGNTAWSGQGGAGSTALTELGNSTGKGDKWMTGHDGASGTGTGVGTPVSNSSYGINAGSFSPSNSLSAPPGLDPAVVTSQPTGTQNITYPQLPGDGPFQATNQSGGGGNGQQQSSSADLLQPQVVLDFTSKGVMRSSSQEETFSTPTGSPPLADKEKITVGDVGCPICRNDIATDPTPTKCCNQIFCKSCLKESLKHSPYCPTCKEPLRKVKGNQPAGGTMTHCVLQSTSLPGYEGAGAILISYEIPHGIQTKEHPHPGQPYHGTRRSAYLPNTPEGQEVLRLLKKAFDARLIFTVGTSHTTSASNTVVWNDIHHKTVTHGHPYGYPDPTYLSRVKEELKAKGIQ